MRVNRSIIIAAVIAVGVTGWIISGNLEMLGLDKLGIGKDAIANVDAQSDTSTGKISTVTEPEKVEKVVPPTTVTVQTMTALPRTQHVVVRGITEALRKVDVKAETDARIVETYVEPGQRVKKGDMIARFAIKDRKAKLEEAEALVQQRDVEYNVAKQLIKKGFSSKTKYYKTQAELDSAKAQVKSMRIRLEDLRLRAPFDGIVEDRQAEVGDYLKVGNVVATIVDENPFLVTAQISELDVGKISVGNAGTATIVTGQQLQGNIRFISKTADAATRTFRVELEVDNEDYSLRGGMTAKIVFSTKTIMAHFMSAAYLTLSEEGQLGVRSVDNDNRVQFYPVAVLADNQEGVWVGGLPETVRIITIGQDFVRHGDIVAPGTDSAGVAQ
jgi:membrane fusion protein, multidrug efflux system